MACSKLKPQGKEDNREFMDVDFDHPENNSDDEVSTLLPIPDEKISCPQVFEESEPGSDNITDLVDKCVKNSESAEDIIKQFEDNTQPVVIVNECNLVIQYYRENHPNYYDRLAVKYNLPRLAKELLPPPPTSVVPPKEEDIPVEKCSAELEAEKLAREIFKHSCYQEKVKLRVETKTAAEKRNEVEIKGGTVPSNLTQTQFNSYIYDHLSVDEKRKMAVCKMIVCMRQSKNPVVSQSSWKVYGSKHCMAEEILKNCDWVLPSATDLQRVTGDWHAATELRKLWDDCCRMYGL